MLPSKDNSKERMFYWPWNTKNTWIAVVKKCSTRALQKSWNSKSWKLQGYWFQYYINNANFRLKKLCRGYKKINTEKKGRLTKESKTWKIKQENERVNSLLKNIPTDITKINNLISEQS